MSQLANNPAFDSPEYLVSRDDVLLNGSDRRDEVQSGLQNRRTSLLNLMGLAV